MEMKNLRNSILALFIFFSIVLSIAQVEYFEENILNFQAAFFIMLVIATVIGIWGPSRIKISIYVYMGLWAVTYALVWALYWRFLPLLRTIEELSVQFLLIEIAAALSHNVGVQINQVNSLLGDVADGSYPNRTLDLKMASDSINTEMNRSRRYSRPLSVLVFQLTREASIGKEFKGVEKDLFSHFMAAKIGRIVNEHARQTDLIMRDYDYRFIVLCPETNEQAALTLAQRIYQAIVNGVDRQAVWSTASFPDEALSFDGLFERAVSRLAPIEEKEKAELVN
ncbi:MAG: hypothetical protein HN392_01535 [Anaerolineae bacterium]|jgi:GGDEF domain-containing protein|nr:hypothetical protein [Anaerolineae bacterium]MBT7075305.1 hypothetical protein [Anaerolineae bacterium]